MKHALLFNVNKIMPRRGVGVYRIASFLREHDWDVEVVDFTIGWSLEELQEFTRSRITSESVFVGFSTFCNNWSNTLNLFTKWLKETYPNVKTVLGAQDVVITPATDIDYWVDGYGERAILEVVKHIVSPGSVSLKYSADYFPQKRVIQANAFYPAYPMKSLLINYEARDFILPNEWLGIELSRGCKFECDFCNYPILGVKDDHSRDSSDFATELKNNYDNWGTTNYHLADETVNDSTDKLIKFADVVEKLNFDPYFTGFIRGDLLVGREEDREHLARMRLFGQYYGIESFNHKSAKSIGKGMSPKKLLPGLLEARQYFKNAGPYRGEISLIVGLQYETKETQQQTFQWLKDHWLGEAVSVYPLMIPIKDYKPSKYTQHWKDSGFKEIPADLVASKYSKQSKMFRKEEIERSLMWETEHFNIFDAIEMTNNWLTESNSNSYFRHSPWSIGLESILNNVDFAGALNLDTSSFGNPLRNQNEIDFINNYKQKKLNNQ